MFGKKAETEVVEEVEHELKFKEWFNLKRLELNKYCKRCGKHTLHKETK